MTLTDLSDEISPFPDAGNLYGDRSTTGVQFLSPLPLRKLRPIRSSGDSSEHSDSPTNLHPKNEDFTGNSLYGDDHQVSLAQKLIVSGEDEIRSFESPATLADGDSSRKKVGTETRWPKAETLALLRIRSEMDHQFRNSNSNRRPIWEIVSKNLEQMGYFRDGKKCKEKFYNIYKYYKKSKEKLRRSGRKGSKIYKFFSELEALDNQNSENQNSGIRLLEKNKIQTHDSVEIANMLIELQTSSTDFSSSGDYAKEEDEGVSGDDNDEDVGDYDDDELGEDIVEIVKGKRKRKIYTELELFLLNLVDNVMKKQEEMHKQLLEIIDKKEKERIIREEAWRQQEMEREKRDKEMRAQETSRSLALISFIGKTLGHQVEIPQYSDSLYSGEDQGEKHDTKEFKFDSSTKRWPKSEVQALITLRTAIDRKFQTVALKHSVWEEISLAMSSMGYSRNAKKCKEKWENINKYFKRTIGSGKKRPVNAKTCPYFHELNILYRNGVKDSGFTPDGTNNEGEDSTKQLVKTSAQVVTSSQCQGA